MSRATLARDPGLQVERTALAWTRTALAGSASAIMVVLRDRDIANLLHDPVRLCVGSIAIAVAAGAFGLGWRRRRALVANPLPPSASTRRDILTLTLAVVVFSALVVTYLLTALG